MIFTDKIMIIDFLKIDMWSYEEVGMEIFQCITENFKKLQKKRTIVTIIIMTSSLTCYPVDGDNRDFFVVAYSIDHEKSLMIQLIIKLTIIIPTLYISYLGNCFIFSVVFVLDDLSSHLLMIREKIKSISRIYGEDDNLLYCDTYQKNVNVILTKCILEHNHILR